MQQFKIKINNLDNSSLFKVQNSIKDYKVIV